MSEQLATVEYIPGSYDDASRVWRISAGPSPAASAYINIGPTISFDINDPNWPTSVYMADMSGEAAEESFAADRALLAELFGLEVAQHMGRVPNDDEFIVDEDDYYPRFEIKVPLGEGNPPLRRILGRLALIDEMRRDRSHTYTIPAEEKQKMKDMFGPDCSLLKFREGIESAKNRFYAENPMPTEQELADEEAELLSELPATVPQLDLDGWIEGRQLKSLYESGELEEPFICAGGVYWLDQEGSSRLVVVMGLDETCEGELVFFVLPVETETTEPNMHLFGAEFPGGSISARLQTEHAELVPIDQLRDLEKPFALPTEMYEALLEQAHQEFLTAFEAKQVDESE